MAFLDPPKASAAQACRSPDSGARPGWHTCRGPTSVVCRYIAGVLCSHTRSESLVHSAFSRLAVRRDGQ
jgi:hypothetical protein